MTPQNSADLLAKLKQDLSYDPETGMFHWTRGGGPARRPSGIAGDINAIGYRRIRLGGDTYVAHRIAWLFHYGELPDDDVQIDHINGDRADNRISNLRLATRFENTRNSRRRRDNTSGVKGVGWHKSTGKWVAYIRENGKHRHLGLFRSIDEAADTVRRARERLHGEFANHGIDAARATLNGECKG